MDLGALFQLVLRYAVIPEVARIINEHNAKKDGTTLTDVEIIAKLPADLQGMVSGGQAFLDRTRPTT